MAKNVQVTINKVPELVKALKTLTENRVMVGVPSTNTDRKENEPINNAQIMAIHEYGAPEANIPARPVVLPTVRGAKENITNALSKAGKMALGGKPDEVLKVYNALGITVQNKMRARIRAVIPPPLAESTLAARRARGRTGTKPLWDTGQLLKSLTYVIRKIKYKGSMPKP